MTTQPSRATAFSDTSFEDAFFKAAAMALKGDTSPTYPDRMDVVKMVELGALYGGIAGFTGQRYAIVESQDARGVATSRATDREIPTPFHAASAPDLSLTLSVHPKTLTINELPPIKRPQPRTLQFVLEVKNTGSAPFTATTATSEMFSCSLLDGRFQVGRGPSFVLNVLTTVTIDPGSAHAFSADCVVDDALMIGGKSLVAVARFVPTGQTAKQDVPLQILK